MLIGLISVCALLPRRLMLSIGRVIGKVFYWKNAKRRRIADINIALCFPALDAIDRSEMVQRHFLAYGQGIVDLGLAWAANPGRLERWCSIEGIEQCSAMLAAGQRILLITPHTIGIDLGGVLISRHVTGVSMMKRPKNRLLAWWLWRSRSRNGARILMRDQGLRSLVRAMREGRCAYLMPDEDLRSERVVFAPFFGACAASVPVVGRLAAMTDAKVLPVITRLGDSGQYKVIIGPPFKDFPTGDDINDVAHVNRVFEDFLSLAPHQYLWTLKWFNSQPAGESSPYD